MFRTTKGLVVREVRYKEADRILTVLTESDGKMTVKARGALRKGSKTAAATQLLCWSELTLFQNKGKWTVNEASTIEEFTGLRADISALALASYFAEALEALTEEDVPDPAVLQLGLNSLYALSNRLYPPARIKAAFETRLMVLSGYEPDLSGCAVCGAEMPAEPLFSVENGVVCCAGCRKAGAGETVRLTPAAFLALRYYCRADAKRLFSFPIAGEDADKLSAAAECYFLRQTERRFGTLDYWKKIKD
ncbi:MAG: DNA repair protein RecO [Oscillospiraceae bacterium]|nr:DNA repair protein RecO [Oscillospiraceae bacterium]